MSISVPITKPQFLAAFKTCDKYLKSNYIEQEIFFHNMVYAMGMAKQYLPDKIASELEFFDDGAYRKEAVNVVKTLGPEYWRNYGNMSEQMRAEANRFFFAAGTDTASIAIGAGVGKLASKATKAISRPYAKHLVSKTVKRGGKVTVNGDVNVNRLMGTKGVPTQMEASIGIKTQNKVWRKELLPWKKPKVYKEVVISATINPIEVFANQVSEGITDYAEQTLAPNLVSDDTFSFSFGDSLFAEAGNVVTDFIPYVGNAKAAVSAVTNLAIGYEYSKTAKKIEELENQNMEADRKFFNAYLFVDIEKDLNAMDKTTLYRMWLFASSQYNQMFVRKLQ